MLTETRPRYIPNGAHALNLDEVNAVVYVYKTKSGKPCAIAYSGKRSKADWHYSYNTEEALTNQISRYLDGLKAAKQYKDERAAERNNFVNPFKVGDILHGSWGWEQTNCEFAEVVAVKGRMVTFRQLQTECVCNDGGSSMSTYLMPKRGAFCGEPITAQALPYTATAGYVKLSQFCHLTIWDGRKKYSSWYA